MSQINCQLRLGEVPLHLYQVITGFKMLEKQGVVKLDIEIIKNHEERTPYNILEVIINNDIKIYYDVNDGYDNLLKENQNYQGFMNSLLEKCDFYFKRSFSSLYNKRLKQQEKIFPLGLNYMVTTQGNKAHMPLPHDPSKEKMKKLIRLFPLSEFYNGNYNVNYFEDSPRLSETPKILFMARLWDVKGDFPGQISKEKMEERRYINSVRAMCIRLCKQEFGDQFFGGVNATPYALENYKDLVIADKNITNRKNYLKRLKDSHICIATMGLHESIGWKFAEYIAASKAIVTEELRYEVPGNFKEGRNYLTFFNPDHCIDQINRIIGDKDYMYNMMVNNFEYYHQYVRPDRLILNSILTVLNAERLGKNEQNTNSVYSYV
ncbi:glycosyltransferase [Metabacillus halosaccharovorans]|uniref:glycosyltransferase n=1 Tax=Metabacillus halosaccharovorans TaxID=930124 RepID=UPI0034CDBF43